MSAPNFQGGCLLQIWGGEDVCSKFLGGCLLQIFFGGVSGPGGVPPIFRIRSTFGRYASYWNAFLFLSEFTFVKSRIIF